MIRSSSASFRAILISLAVGLAPSSIVNLPLTSKSFGSLGLPVCTSEDVLAKPEDVPSDALLAALAAGTSDGSAAVQTEAAKSTAQPMSKVQASHFKTRVGRDLG